ncbi:MAG: hypothetical protein H0W84_11385, partial [Bacteroidetes bacterium]|nr:hypothetical protein [Bacteroidota bacterium]
MTLCKAIIAYNAYSKELFCTLLLVAPILSSKVSKDVLNIRIVNADRVAVRIQKPAGGLDYYRYRIGIISGLSIALINYFKSLW